MYIARVYEKITDDRAIYQGQLLKIPTPEFIVLYNGATPFPTEKTLRLSDAYIATDESLKRFGNLELTVRILNINPGHNDDLMQKCTALSDYTTLVEYVRDKQRFGSNLRDAVSDAIKWSLNHGIMAAFLTEHGSEVTSMLMTEFNIDIAREVWQEEAYADAVEDLRADMAALAVEIAAKDAEIAAQDAENVRLSALVAELQMKLEKNK